MNNQQVIFALIIVFALVTLGFLYFISKILRLWLQAVLSGANISALEIILMSLRGIPARKVVELRIMAAQAGLSVSTRQIQSAILQQADVELIIRAMIRAMEIQTSLTWEEALAEDNRKTLLEMLELSA